MGVGGLGGYIGATNSAVEPSRPETLIPEFGEGPKAFCRAIFRRANAPAAIAYDDEYDAAKACADNLTKRNTARLVSTPCASTLGANSAIASIGRSTSHAAIETRPVAITSAK